MATDSSPKDPKKFIIQVFISFVIVFVFAMLMMLWQGQVVYSNGHPHYETAIKEP